MVFSSNLFLYYFLPVALLAYFAVPRRARNLTLAALSYVFYGWSNPAFTLLLALSTGIDYACGLAIARARARGRGSAVASPISTATGRLALLASIATNLGLLGFFKYFNLAASAYDDLVHLIGAPSIALDTTLRVTLPLGISFYTFQSMSYTIDVYRGRVAALRNPIDFACYVSMFPQLVAGPIVRFADVADQFVTRTHSVARAARGAAIFSLGLAKKVLLANPCGQVADTVFALDAPATADAWVGLLAYAFQIYFDFSGYSDMAIGLGLILGFVLPRNFDDPYLAESITDFWRRWHITLSSWLRDYLYVPLGGNRRGPVRTYVNLMLVMLLGGLWHGADWKFVVWGGWHGLLLACERARGGRPLYSAWPRPARIACTFVLVLAGWVLFRAPSLGDAGRLFLRLAGLGDPSPASALATPVVYAPYLVTTMAVSAVIVWWGRQTLAWTADLSAGRLAVIGVVLALSLAALATQSYNPFIYFIF